MADKELSNPGGAFGYTGVMDNQWQLDAYYKASTAVVAGNVVAIGTDGTIIPAAVGTNAILCIGVAPKAIAAGANGIVTLYGVVDNCVAEGAIATGDRVKRSATTAAAVAVTATPAAGEVIGFAISGSAAGVVSIFVCKSLATT